MSLNPELDHPDRSAIVGASYLRRNIDTLAKLIDSLPRPAVSVEAAPDKEIVWYRPGGTSWGCSPDLRDAVRSIKTAIRHKFGRTAIRTTLVFPEASRGRDYPRRFEGLFDAGYIAPEGFLDPSIEVLHIPGIASLLLVNVALSPTVHIPVGFASTASEPLERIVSKLTSLQRRLEELWREDRREDDEPTAMEPDEDAQDD
jgi:hypothetical protein